MAPAGCGIAGVDGERDGERSGCSGETAASPRRATRGALESLGKTSQASRVAELGDTLADLLRDLVPATSRSYPGSVEQ